MVQFIILFPSKDSSNLNEGKDLEALQLQSKYTPEFFLVGRQTMKIIITLTLIFITSCSSNRVKIHPQTENEQTITYARGGVVLHSNTSLKPELTIIDYSYDEMIIGLSVTNTTSEPVLFSEKNIQVELLGLEESQQGTIYSFEQLIEEAAERGDSTLYQVGNTAVSIGVGFIPFGGIAYSVGRMLYSLGDENSRTHENRIDVLTFSQLNKNYLRQQTIEPNSSYAGILKIGFEDELEEGDTITFQVLGGNEIEKFNFTCKTHPK
jgi:hypothetical protein